MQVRGCSLLLPAASGSTQWFHLAEPSRKEKVKREKQHHSLERKQATCLCLVICLEMHLSFVLLQVYSMVRHKWRLCAREEVRKSGGYTSMDVTGSMIPQAEIILHGNRFKEMFLQKHQKKKEASHQKLQEPGTSSLNQICQKPLDCNPKGNSCIL